MGTVIAVIGCGNPNRRDDGAGPEVIRRLRARPALAGRDEVRLLDAGTDGMSVMFAARGCGSLIVVDASRTGSNPGALFEVPGCELEQAHSPNLTLHDFRWDHALFAGRKIFREAFPDDVTVLLIEAESVDLGLGLSPAVGVTVDRVVARVEALVGERLAGAEGRS